MSKPYRSWEPDQMWLLPPSPSAWLEEGDLVYFLLDTVRELDISAITVKYEQESRGFPPYHPRMMVTLLLYAYCRGIFSSRRIEQACRERVTFRVIVGPDIPNFRTISDFRKLHLKELQTLFVQVLRLCQAAGLVKLGTVALDGTKVKANASRHKAMSYGYMKQEEVRLEKEIGELLAQAQTADEAEDQTHGSDRRGDELPAELARRATRLQRIREAKRALEDQAKAAAETPVANHDTPEPPAKKPNAPAAVPDDKKQYNFTDPESRIMKANNKGWDQCGNAQAVVESSHQIILADDVTNEANDKRQAEPMLSQAQANVGEDQPLGPALMDNGYYSESNVMWMEQNGIDGYVATERIKHNDRVPALPEGPMPADLSTKEKMAWKLRTTAGRAIYALRKQIVEPVFGQIKRARGFGQFLLRGLEKMRGEWSLICLTHNLLKLFGVTRQVKA
jgi:transposase